MYVCCIHTFMDARMHVCAYVCMYVCMYVCVWMYVRRFGHWSLKGSWRVNVNVLVSFVVLTTIWLAMLR